MLGAFGVAEDTVRELKETQKEAEDEAKRKSNSWKRPTAYTTPSRALKNRNGKGKSVTDTPLAKTATTPGSASKSYGTPRVVPHHRREPVRPPPLGHTPPSLPLRRAYARHKADPIVGPCTVFPSWATRVRNADARTNAGKVEVEWNPEKRSDKISEMKGAVNLDIAAYATCVQEPYRHMFEKLRDRADGECCHVMRAVLAAGGGRHGGPRRGVYVCVRARVCVCMCACMCEAGRVDETVHI